MGIFDRRKEKEKDKKESPEWLRAYMPSYSFITDKGGNPCGAFALNEGVATRFPKKPGDFYEETPKFIMIVVSSTDKKIIGELDYDKAIKQLDKYKTDETKDEILIRELTYQEIGELLK